MSHADTIGGTMTLEVAEKNEQAPEQKTMTWRVLSRVPDATQTGTVVGAWIERAPLTGSGQFGYYPGAAEVGERYGEGDYILIREEDGYARAEFLSVVADTVYRLAEADEA